MLKLLLFLKRIHLFLLFILLESIAVAFFVKSNIYQKARIVGASTAMTGAVYDGFSSVNSYFGLRQENDRLMEEVARLQSRLSTYVHADSLGSLLPDSLASLRYYEYHPARVVGNKINSRENYITIDRGRLDGIEPEMALISPDGIVGYVLSCSDHYSIAISLLHTDFRGSGRIKGGDFFGSLYWDGVSHREMVLDDVPKYAAMEPGDTVVTTAYSYIFPPDQPIGTVVSYEMVNGTFYKVRVRLFADIASLRYVYVVRYLEQQERRELENNIPAPGSRS